MYVEVGGVNFVNKGAELMLHAVKQRLSGGPLKARIVLRPEARYFAKAFNQGIYRKLSVRKLGIVRNLPALFAPQVIRRKCRWVTEDEIDALLDASGFAYSDQWGLEPSQKLLELGSRWKAQGKRIILLPQAFGPFEDPVLRETFARALQHVDLVFARDEVSYQYLQTLGELSTRVEKAPDFTNLVQGEVPGYYENVGAKVCIIPNYRMMDKTSQEVRQRYIDFLLCCVRYLSDQGLDYFVLIHESERDRNIAHQLEAAHGQAIEIIEEENPLYIKGILGRCHAVIGSRFHGLVSSLSQGIPSLATGWSHKYQMLFEDYGCPDFLVSPTDSSKTITEKLERLLMEPGYSEVKERLLAFSEDQKRKSEAMWSRVEDVLK